MSSGSFLDRVIVVSPREYARFFRRPPTECGFGQVNIDDITGFLFSNNRLAPEYARAVYERGEVSMGGLTFRLELKDVSELATCHAGFLVDFVGPFEGGSSARDVRRVFPGEGGDDPGAYQCDADLTLCLFPA